LSTKFLVAKWKVIFRQFSLKCKTLHRALSDETTPFFFFFYGPQRVPRCRRSPGNVRPLNRALTISPKLKNYTHNNNSKKTTLLRKFRFFQRKSVTPFRLFFWCLSIGSSTSTTNPCHHFPIIIPNLTITSYSVTIFKIYNTTTSSLVRFTKEFFFLL
jgi:hypothetical protein